jgi:hypothetical protein
LGGGKILSTLSGLVKQKIALKEKKKMLRIQINGKSNDVSNTDENEY